MIAHVVAGPVLELAGRGFVAGAGRHAAYVDLDGFVVALTARGVPLMPNGIALAGDPPRRGARVSLDLEGVEVWDPTLRLDDDIARRGAEVLRALGGADVDEPLRRALAERDPELAARAAERLVGRGPGLTPEGDDVLAGAAAVVAAGPWPADARDPWLRALVPADLRRRTTALSATLLELAVAGQAIEPLHGLFTDRWPGALQRLLRLGHSTGRAYAAAAAYAAASCTSSTRISSRSA